MKYQIAMSMAVIALLTSSAKATQNKHTGDEFESNPQYIGISQAQKTEEMVDLINQEESSNSNKKLFANIDDKLQDKNFVETAAQLQAKRQGHETHSEEYEDLDARSGDLYKDDYGGRNTDMIGEWQKDYEDNFNEGKFNTGKASEIKTQGQHTQPGSWDKMGPTNVPKHLKKGDFKAADGPSSGGNVVNVYLTVDNDEDATRFVKALFNQNLIAEAQQIEGGFERTYLKLGRMVTEKGRDELQLTTTADRVSTLIDYINNNNPTQYDYPVPDTHVIPVTNGNPEYLAWVSAQMGQHKGLAEDGTHDSLLDE